jgi:hypothetical protein
MYLLITAEGYIEAFNGAAFLLSLFVIGLFYPAYQKCMEQIEKEEMLEQFLKD